MSRTIIHIFATIAVMLLLASCHEGSTGGSESMSGEDVQHRMVERYKASFGMNLEDFDTSYFATADSLFDAYELHEKHIDKEYYELARMLVGIQSRSLNTIRALAVADKMWKNAVDNDDKFGKLLSMSAMLQVSSEKGIASSDMSSLGMAVNMLDVMPDVEPEWKMIIYFNALRRYTEKDYALQAKAYLEELEEVDTKDLSNTSSIYIAALKAYYYSALGDTTAVKRNLAPLDGCINTLPQGIKIMANVSYARLLCQQGDKWNSLAVYNTVLEGGVPKNPNSMELHAMRKRAEMLMEMGLYDQACAAWMQIYDISEDKFATKTPEAIEKLVAEFENNALSYLNIVEHSRTQNAIIIVLAISLFVIVVLLLYMLFAVLRFKYLTSKLNALKKAAEKATSKKSFFLSNMSHEIRTPLNAIMGFSQLLTADDDDDPEMRAEYLRIIQVNCDQLLKLINDILDLSELEEGRISFVIETHDIGKLCSDAVDTIKKAVSTDVDIRYECDISEPIMVETDSVRMRQVLLNLLMNATKFTKEGSIVLQLRRCDMNSVIITVTDTGCGIPKDKQRQIFDRFEKLNEFVQGTGLGLSICMLIMKALQCRIWVDDSYTDGARFCVMHPIKR